MIFVMKYLKFLKIVLLLLTEFSDYFGHGSATTIRNGQEEYSRNNKYNYYFDSTTLINQILEKGGAVDPDGIETLLLRFNNSFPSVYLQSVYFSTDALVSEMSNLSPVFDLLNKWVERTSTLLLSFRFFKDGKVNPNLFQNILYTISKNGSSCGDAGSLNRQVSEIVIDFTNETDTTTDNYDPCAFEKTPLIKYLRKWNISLVKNSRRIVADILGSSGISARIQFGVSYDIHQVKCDFIRSQIKSAEFVIVGTELGAVSPFPLTEAAFEKYLEGVTNMNHHHLENVFGNDGETMPDVGYRIVLRKNKAMKSILANGNNSKMDKMTISLMEELFKQAENIYPILLEQYFFAHRLPHHQSKPTTVVLSSFNSGRKNESEDIFNEYFLEPSFSRQIPFLYLQEGNSSACSVVKTLDYIRGITKDNPGIILNEYTWNSIARFKNKIKLHPYIGYMINDDEPCSTILSYWSPFTAHLFLSDGIGAVWNYAKNTLTKLLTQDSISEIVILDTIFISDKDLKDTICGFDNSCYDQYMKEDGLFQFPRIGMLKFLDDVQRSLRHVSVGCAVNFGRLSNLHGNVNLTADTMNRCNPIFVNSTKIIWKFELNTTQINSTEFCFRFDENSVKYKLFLILVWRQKFMNRFEGKEVIIQLKPNDKDLQRIGFDAEYVCSSVDDFYKAVDTWAWIYRVKVILRPLYDAQYPWFGFDAPYNENGEHTFNRSCSPFPSYG